MNGPDDIEVESIDNILANWIENPLHCGYLLSFCSHEYSSENVRYLIEVDKFRDLIRV